MFIELLVPLDLFSRFWSTISSSCSSKSRCIHRNKRLSKKAIIVLTDAATPNLDKRRLRIKLTAEDL